MANQCLHDLPLSIFTSIKQTIMENQYLSKSELAQRLKRSERTLDRWLASGLLSASARLNGRPLFLMEEVERMIYSKKRDNPKI
jgi:hypothetical protein